MKKYMAVAAAGIAALCLAWAGGRMTVPEILAKSDGPPQGLAMRVAGAWSFHLYLGDSTTPTLLVGTINADGTSLTAGGPLTSGSTVTDALATWKFVGKDKMAGTFKCLGYFPDNTYGWYEIGQFEYTVNRDGNQLEGTALIGNYAPDQVYPEDEPAYGSVECKVIGWKIEAE